MKELPVSARVLIIAVHVMALICAGTAISAFRIPLEAPPWEIMAYGVLAIVAGSHKVSVTTRKGDK